MTAYKIQLSIDLKSIETKMICLHMSVACHSICNEQQFEEDPMWIKKNVCRFQIFHWENSCRHFKKREGDDKGNVKTNKQTSNNKQSRFRLTKKTRQKNCACITLFYKFLCPYGTRDSVITSGKRQKFKTKAKEIYKRIRFLCYCLYYRILYRIASPFDLKSNPVKCKQETTSQSLGVNKICKSSYNQKHITPKRLNYPYLFRTMLGFFSQLSRPIRSTENYFAQIWNQRIQG